MKALSLRPFLFLVFALLTSIQARAQMPTPETIDSIDLKVLNSKTVVVGRIATITPAEEDGPPEVTVAIEQILKGATHHRLRTTLPFAQRQVEKWQSYSARLLIAFPSGPMPKRPWVVDLDAKDLAVPKKDFTVFREPDKVIRYVRELARNNPGVNTVAAFSLAVPQRGVSVAWRSAFRGRYIGGLAVPADKLLEQVAREEIRSQAFAQRAEGAKALRFFKSNDNAARIKPLLRDPAFVVTVDPKFHNGLEGHHFPVRAAAFDTLQSWGEVPPKPVIDESVSKIATLDSLYWFSRFGQLTDADLEVMRRAQGLKTLGLYGFPLPEAQLEKVGALTQLTHLWLGEMTIGDAGIGHLAGLKNLESLTLDKNPITDRGLMKLAGFGSLHEVSVRETEVTDAGLAALRRARPDMRIFPAEAISPIDVYIRHRDLEGVRRVLDHAGAVGDLWSAGDTPLHRAAEIGDYEMAKLLLDRGMPVDPPNYVNETPLLIAARPDHPHPSVIRLLIGRGADVNHVGASGNSALDLAMNSNDPGLVRFLLACGADPEQYKRYGSYGIATQPNEKCLVVLSNFLSLRKKRVPLIEQTHVPCDRVKYWLDTYGPHEGDRQNWSSKTLGRLAGPVQWSRSPSGRVFLGPFGQQALTFKLTRLKKHRNIRIDMELFVIGSWDGNAGLGSGPDVIDIQIPGVGTALHSTFFNNTEDGDAGLGLQSFPDQYPFGFHKGYTGASQIRNLGFTEPWNGRVYHRDAVYSLQYTVAHTGADLEVVITGQTVPEEMIHRLADDENWGISSFIVKTD